jgi:hypothetical protein
MFHPLKNQRGISLPLFLALLLMITLVGILAISNSLTNMDISGNRNTGGNLVYSAEAGVERAVARIRVYYDSTNTIMPNSSYPCDSFPLGKDSVGYFTLCDSGNTPLISFCNSFQSGGIVSGAGVFSGLRGNSVSYRIISEAWRPKLPNKARIIQQVAVYNIPVFRFSAIYDTFDLEISPENMFTNGYHLNGRIHTNKDLYVESHKVMTTDSSLFLQNNVSARGHIFHGHNATTYTGTWPNFWGATDSGIFIRDAIGVDRSMKDGSGWLDHNRSSDWIQSSLTRWGGTVEDSSHKISDLYLKMVLPVGKTPHDLITRMLNGHTANTTSLENQAHLRISSLQDVHGIWRGYATWWNGTSYAIVSANLFTDNTPNQIVTEQTTCDYRENKIVHCYQLDIARLRDYTFGGTSRYPDNGIIYITNRNAVMNNTDIWAVMIVNAGTLPRPTTIVSNGPIYVLSDSLGFNWNNPQPAAIIADAVTFLSGNTDPTHWVSNFDSTEYYDDDTLSHRHVDNDYTINACIMAGNRPTTSSRYSGGLWNLVRLLEDWNSTILTINGSMACFWRSQVDTAAYEFPRGSFTGQPTPYYRAPILTLTYDNQVAGGILSPPGTPFLNLVIKTKRSVEGL